MSISVLKVGRDKTAFDLFVEQHPYGNLLQTSSWSQVKSNWQSHQLSFYRDQKLVACASVLIKTVIKNIRVAYVPRGPVVDYGDPELVKDVFKELKNYARKEKYLLLKCDPNVLFDREDLKQTAHCQQLIEDFEKIGYSWTGLTLNLSDTIQPRFQANKYLSQDSFKDYQKHVNRLTKTATKKGVEIIKGSEEEVKLFSELVVRTEQRKNIHLRNYDYFEKIKTIYGNKAEFHFATINSDKQLAKQNERLLQLENALAETPEHQKNRLKELGQQKASVLKQIDELTVLSENSPSQLIIAGVLGIRFASGIELLYASMDERFKHYYPQYLLDTEIFKTCHQEGLSWANMGGVEGNLEGGLSVFKLSFKPTIEEYIGEFNLSANQHLYHLGNNVYRIYKKLAKQINVSKKLIMEKSKIKISKPKWG
ncbi:peptidoglycan branched peptide synthesis protein, serine/alanine adding enzyme [Streptococcus pseudoporcinus]|uniref:Peptidoglycan branched peptide synthesis protein, serine/alanine adding enzyme n=1 Tax=Streptococcus pseudoporcinus TaxID=361101 RepID=A0A4U9ZKG6_9STRE|nr:peptidoglycan bridge formation glycyltransferase FemA/FemB family protein [Streptococcus pseudoporcinus]VTS40722.1 peptidoglycan branched peptide synthesis protein, serine/alanine adding enzyme [Streptococcus pseudoporcinus]